MKILILSTVNDGEVGGIYTYEKLISEYIENNKGYVCILRPKTKYRFFKISGAWLLFRLEILNKWDVVIVNNPHVSLLALIGNFINAKQRIFVSHGWIFHREKGDKLKKIFSNWAKIVLRRYDIVACISEQDKKIITSNNAVVCGNPISIPSYVDLSNKIKHKILVVGRDYENKNYKTIRKFIDYCKDRNSLEFHVVGPIINTKNVVNYTNITDSELNNLYNSSVFYLSLSTYEGFGMTVIEATSRGCIPILSDIEAYRNHNLGVKLFDLNQDYFFRDMVDFINDNVNNDNLKLELMEKSRSYTVENYLTKLKII